MSVADTIIKKCGGVARAAELAETTENWVYRWRMTKGQGGTGGRVPEPAQRKLIAAARKGLVDISPADFFPLEGAKQ